MKIIIAFLGTHTELTDGFAWLLIWLVASGELWLVAGIYKILEKAGIL